MIYLFSLDSRMIQSRTLHSNVLCVSVEHICTPKWVYLCSSDQSRTLHSGVLYVSVEHICTPKWVYLCSSDQSRTLHSGALYVSVEHICTSKWVYLCSSDQSRTLVAMYCVFLWNTSALPSGCTCVFQFRVSTFRTNSRRVNCVNKTFFFKTKSPI